jgi:hypothetical protein
MERQSAWTELSKAREVRKHEEKMAKISLKKEEAKAQQDKAEGIKSKTEVNKAKVAVEHKKIDLKVRAKAAKMANRRNVQQLARHCHKHCVDLHSQNDDGWNDKLCEIAKKHAVAGKVSKTRPCPHFFDVETDLLLDVTYKTHFSEATKPTKKSSPTTYCSDAFASALFNGPQEKSKHPNPSIALRVKLCTLLPGYHAVIPSEYHYEALLNKNNRIVDLCFLEAAWRYGKHMKELFPLDGAFTLPDDPHPGVAKSPPVGASSSASPAAPASASASALPTAVVAKAKAKGKATAKKVVASAASSVAKAAFAKPGVAKSKPVAASSSASPAAPASASAPAVPTAVAAKAKLSTPKKVVASASSSKLSTPKKVVASASSSSSSSSPSSSSK